jgi:hypothetical protein
MAGGLFAGRLKWAPHSRQRAFWAVCVPVRVGLAVAAGAAAATDRTLAIPVVALALVAAIVLFVQMWRDGPVWWSRGFHLGAALVVTGTAVVVATSSLNGWWLTLPLLVDVSVGTSTAVANRPWVGGYVRAEIVPVDE